MPLPPWSRDVLGVALGVAGVVVLTAGLVMTIVVAGAVPVTLTIVGLLGILVAARLARYDPEIAAARRARRVAPPTRP